jgi:hypothetical protein
MVASWPRTSDLAPVRTWESHATSQQMNAVIVVPSGVGTEELTHPHGEGAKAPLLPRGVDREKFPRPPAGS